MLLIPQEIEMKWHQRYRNYYEKKGYTFTNYRETFKVDVNDLPENCNKYIKVLCDYCLEKGITNVVSKPFQAYVNQNMKSIIKKDCCKKCKPLKVKESNLLVYEKESTNQIDEVKQKRAETNRKRYGGDNVMSSIEVRNKVSETNLKRYGSKTPAQNDLVKAKMYATNIDRYGDISPTSNKEVRRKQIISMKERYGVEYGMQNEIILNKARSTLYANGTAPISKQQSYIHAVTGGDINYPFKNYSLDIAFPNELLYIECDFGGHKLQVKLGNKSEKEFKEDEKRRSYFLSRRGWKEIRIISNKDKVPSPERITQMIEYAKAYLGSNHSWIHFELDTKRVVGNQFEAHYEFGPLRYMYQIDKL